jgi:GT2 family glycosyltransferase/glycosyltransferase involved in cell wall biosynthesis
MGNAAFLSGRYGVALEYFELAVQDNPKLKTILDLNVAIAKKRQSAGALDANVARESVSNDDLETIEKIRSMQKKELMKVISDSGYFDASWYVKEYADVGANKKINPLDHFTRNGLREKRNPGARFDVKWYLKKYPFVLSLGINPVVHYELIGKKLEYLTSDPENKVTSWWSRAPSYSAHSAAPDLDYELLSNDIYPTVIIIPIFNAVKDLERCIKSVLMHTHKSYRLILINDSSTDPAVNDLLFRYKLVKNIEIYRNDRNLGFTSTVNKGLLMSDKSDVVLLNSDTIVTPNWLVNLRLAAYSGRRVGTATAFSNNAGAFSVPAPGKENFIPLGYTLSQWARAINQAIPKTYPETPTGHGFCMYIRRDCLSDVGLLDSESFPRGYGEENDFSMRAIRRNWKHVIARSTYIYHVKSASFGDEKTKLLADGRSIIDQKYPEYTKMVRAFMQRADMVETRNEVQALHDLVISELPLVKPRILYVLATKTGGTPQTNEDLMIAVSDKIEAFVLYCNSSKIDLYHFNNGKYALLFTGYVDEAIEMFPHQSVAYDEIVRNLLVDYSFELVHVRHIAWHSLGLIDLAKNLGIPVIFSFHDFYTICPTVKLLDSELKYCGGNCTTGGNDCAWELWPKNQTIVLKNNKILEWRGIQEAMLLKCDAFITTSQGAKQTILGIYPLLQRYPFRVISHGRDFETFRTPKIPDFNGLLKLLVPGNISKAKGGGILEALSHRSSELNIEIHILGIVSSDVDVSKMIVHGPYERGDFVYKVQSIAPDIGCVLSVWPETYCHTLTELWAAGLTVLAFDIGAVGERVRDSGAGFLLKDFDASAIARFLIDLRADSANYMQAMNRLDNWQKFESTKNGCSAMADQYLEFYRLFVSDF